MLPENRINLTPYPSKKSVNGTLLFFIHVTKAINKITRFFRDGETCSHYTNWCMR